MAFIQDIRVNIIDGTRTVSQKGFGMPLILGNSTGSTHLETYFEFTDLAAVKEQFADTTTEYDMAAALFSQDLKPDRIAIYSKGAYTEDSIKSALDDVLELHPGFYAVFIAERDTACLQEAGDWAETNEKFFFGASTASAALTGRNNSREAYLIHKDAATIYPECAWAGLNLPKDPGSITWKWKALKGYSAADYTLSDLETIRGEEDGGANGQTITEIGGIAVVNEGRCTSGEYIDVIRGRDWVKARIEEGLYQLFISNDKVAMDNVGIAQVESVIRSVLKLAGNKGIIARATSESELAQSDDKEFMYQVSVPRREDIDPTSRQNRILPGVEFTYNLAGAIHEAEVTGKITV